MGGGGGRQGGLMERRKEGRQLDDACHSDGWEVDLSKTCWQTDEKEELERMSLRTSVCAGEER